MPWSIGLRVGEHFADLVALNKEFYKRRFYYPQSSVEATLSALLQELQVSTVAKVRLYPNWPFEQSQSGQSDSAAVLITAGFENWLEMTMPLKTWHFTSEARRPAMPIDRDLFLGVSERTNAQGQIEKPVDHTELEFLSSKLQLHQIKDIAICFLHSARNNENEMRAKEFFETKGFRVHLSCLQNGHDFHLMTDEKSRFLSTIVTARSFEPFLSRIKKIQSVFETLAPGETNLVFVGDHPLQEIADGRVPLLKAATSYYEKLSSSMAQDGPIFYAGYENFILFAGRGERQKSWPSPFGPLALATPSLFFPRIQPLSLLTKGFISPVEFSNDIASHDLGPMVFGRGLVPTFFDLVALQMKPDDLQDVIPITDRRNERGRHHLVEQLAAHARNFTDDERLAGETLADRLFMLGCEILQDEIRNHGLNKNLKICGPLATALAQPLGGLSIIDEFEAFREWIG